jgi:hypothetical protein
MKIDESTTDTRSSVKVSKDSSVSELPSMYVNFAASRALHLRPKTEIIS